MDKNYKPLRLNKAELHLRTIFESDNGKPMVAIDFTSSYHETRDMNYPQLSIAPDTITKHAFNILVEKMRQVLTERGILVEENKEERL